MNDDKAKLYSKQGRLFLPLITLSRSQSHGGERSMDAANKTLLLILLLFSDLFICEILSEGVTKEEAKQLRDEVTQSLILDSFSYALFQK